MAKIFLFGDQTAAQLDLLHKIVLRRKNALLVTFLERSSVVLREEIGQLPYHSRKTFPDFLTVGNLLEAYRSQNTKLPQLESAFVTLTQLGHYIGYFTENPSRLPDHNASTTLSLCTGALAAAAVVSAKSISDLVLLAVEAVRIAFRVGVRVHATALALEQSVAPWSTIVTGLSEQVARNLLDAFHADHDIAKSSQVYISAVAATALTLSGPPTITERFFQAVPAEHTIKRVTIPVHAPYHARHLYTDADLIRIIPQATREILKRSQPIARVHSASSGKPLIAIDTLELFQMSLQDMLQNPVRWDFLLQEMAHIKCETIFVMGANHVANSLSATVSAHNVIDQSAWDADASDATSGRTQSDKIAIVGMAGRYPNAANHEALWELLEKGLDVHRKIPSDRFDADAHCDPSGKGKNKSHSPYGCFIDEPGMFDPRFFNMSPREAAQTDPMGRLALTTAYEALEQSGYVPNRTPSTKLHRIGTFYGQTSDDWREINAAENVDTYFITGGVRAFAPGRINYYFKFSGPSFSVDTACSSSLAAIQLACTSLWAGDCDTACAGGLNVLTNPDIFSGLSKGQFLSKTGGCKTFDNAADGYCRGEGAATFILKRYEDAIADKDNILGSILGAATNHSAEAISITHPHAGAQEYLFKKVLADAGVDAHDISYVEMHGTGTQAGDGIEMTSVTNAFAPRERQRTPEQRLYLGAIKANVGHGEAASGVNSLSKILLMLQNNAIPANVGVKGQINQSFPSDLAKRNVHIPLTQVSFPRNGSEKRKIFLNNFSAAGGNTSLLLEDGPVGVRPISKDPRSFLPITVTARSIGALNRNIASLQRYIASENVSLSSLSYTTTARRIQHNYRIAFPATDISKVAESLSSHTKDIYQPVAMVPSKTAFCFTGQGSQYTGLGQMLYEQLPSFKEDIDQLNDIAQVQGLPSFVPLLRGCEVSEMSTVQVQLGMSCIQVALARMWASWGVQPSVVAGHSLGEYAALHVAGVISVSDMIMLVGRRAELLLRNCTPGSHCMLAVKASVSAIEKALGPSMTEVACINGPEDTVLCGSADTISAVNDKLPFKATMLNVPFAFHSAQVDPILDSLLKVASSVTFVKAKVPVLSPVTGKVMHDFTPEYIARHARDTVNFKAALDSGLTGNTFDDKTFWLELGAHPVCSGMVKATTSCPTSPTLRRNEDVWKTISTSICNMVNAGVHVNFDEFHRLFNDAQELLTLPTYNFDNKKYWLDYHNNWTLTKGEAQVPVQTEVGPTIIDSIKKLSDSCQQVISETFEDNTATVIVRSDVTQAALRKVVTGHLVNETALCPSSLYYDMALTVADYIFKEAYDDASGTGYNVADMEVAKPFIINIDTPNESQYLELEANADLDSGVFHMSFRSVTSAGVLLTKHAECIVKCEAVSDWQESWDNIAYMVKSQIENLMRKTQTGQAHIIGRGLAYKLFKTFVDYEATYRGMDEVICDNQTTEATAAIQFKTKEEDGDFKFPAYWCDSMAHLAGFVVNATDLCDTDNFVCVSHGWGSIKLAKPMSADQKYRNYVRMVEKPGNIRLGDVYVFDEQDEIVAVVGAIKFQQIPRKVLNTFLPPRAKASATLPKPDTRDSSVRSGSVTPSPQLRVDIRKPRASSSAAMSSPPSTPTRELRKLARTFSASPLSPPQTPMRAAHRVSTVSRSPSIPASPSMPSRPFHREFGSQSTTPTRTTSPVQRQHSSSFALSERPSVRRVESSKARMQHSSVLDTVMEIIAVETDVDPSELVDDAAFENLGVDSLMSLTISAKFREDLALDISSTLFSDYPTVGEMKRYFALNAKSSPDHDSDVNSVDSSGATAGDSYATPLSSLASPTRSNTSDEKETQILDDHEVSLACHIVAQEMGVDISEISDDADLSDMGMDSLMSLAILGELREKTGVDLPSTFLITNGTIKDIEDALGMRPKKQQIAAPVKDKNAKLRDACKVDISQYPASTSVLLQGNIKTATKRVFFMPDGSGSATSYVSIPNLGSDVAAYGLNCPFMKDPESWQCGIETVAMIYLAEIKRRQPAGPYIIGGWSAGGVIAYAVAQALLANNEEVEKLLLLDSPCPVNLDPLPARLHIFFNEIGLLGTGDPSKTPKWLLPHFTSAIRSLSAYDPQPTLKPIPTYAVWCREGVAGNPGDPRPAPAEDEDPAPMKWLLDHRTDFSDNGWGQLCGVENMKYGVMGGNHFSMMKAPFVSLYMLNDD